jgi:Protein of unknown function (DUF3800)
MLVRPSQAHIVLAGVSVFERQTFWIAQELDAIASRFNQADPLSVELHGSPMHGGRSEWRRFPVADRMRAISDALAVIARSHPSNTLFGAAIKKPISDPGAAIDIAFEQVCRMFDRYLKRLHRQGQTHRGIIVFDKATYETEIQSLAIDFRQFGREWGVIHNLCEVPLFLDSRASRLVQVADLVSFALFRLHERKDSRFFDIIEHRFDMVAGKQRGLVYMDPDTSGQQIIG